jgi:hypothetical protein
MLLAESTYPKTLAVALSSLGYCKTLIILYSLFDYTLM